jgi:hypothetical protein
MVFPSHPNLVPRSALAALLLALPAVLPSALAAQVFTVGEQTATAAIATDFTPTRVTLPDGQLNERGRRELIRGFEAEQGFAHRALPMGGTGLTLLANGNLTPAGSDYRHAIYEHGQACAAGDRILVTALEIKGDRIVIDLNGGPYLKHRFLRHVQINGGNVVNPGTEDKATGARVTLVFEGGIPDLSAPELKALLEPVLDFGVKSSTQAYADTLPTPLKSAIASHEILVGMNRRMVLAALGPPESKLREHANLDGTGTQYEEWIYGHQPQTIRFVRFEGDKVSLIKVAEVGKSIAVRNQSEIAGFVDPGLTRTIASGDTPPPPGASDLDKDPGEERAGAPPTLARPGEKIATHDGVGVGKVQMPTAHTDGKGIPPLPEVQQNHPAPPAPAAQPQSPSPSTAPALQPSW